MELSQLKYFILVAELQNISKASERLSISQPSLSKSISKLEKELGTPLFERVGKKILLNEQGTRFLAGVQSSLQELDDTMDIVSSLSDNAIVRLNLGIFALHSRVVKCLKEFGETHPQVEYIIHSNVSSLENLETDAFDMMIYPLDTAFKKYKGYIIAHEKFRVVVPGTNPLSVKKSIDITELKNEQFVFIRNSKRSLGWPYHSLVNAGLKPKIRCTTDSIESHCQLISSGFAIGLAGEGNMETYAANPDLVVLDIDGIEILEPVMIGFKREKHLSETARIFRSFVIDYFKINTHE